MSTAQHRRFDQGFIQDEGSFLLPEGAVYSSKNMIFDKVGIARKRGPITSGGSTAVYNGDQIGALTMDEGFIRFYQRTDLNAILYTSLPTGATGGAQVGAGAPNPDGGRPFQHYGFFAFPTYGPSTAAPTFSSTPGWVSGATTNRANYGLASPAAVILTAGDKRVTCGGGVDSPLTKAEVGMLFWGSKVGPTEQYIGRITSFTTATAFEVYPTPTVGFTCVSAQWLNGFSSQSGVPGAIFAQIGGKVGMSFQGRVLLGNLSRQDTAGANRIEYFTRRVAFSSTLLEGDTANATTHWSGATWIQSNGWPPLNYFDIPGNDPLTAMSATGFGDAVFFSPFKAFRLTGNLSTQYGTSQSITWAVKEIPNSVGCITERGMQRTPRGIVFPHDSGIYSTDGASMKPLMYGRIQNYWYGLTQGAGFKIYGSALLRGNHYYINGTSGGNFFGLLVNLDTLAWTNLSGKSAAPASWIINSAVQDPGDPSKVWALKWWDQSLTAPTMTNGQIVRLDGIFNPSSTKVDSDTTTVNFEVVTKPYTEESPTIQKTWEKATIEYENIGGPGVAVTPAAVLDSAEMPAGGTNYFLPRQDVYTVTAASNASPIVITCGTHDIKVDSWVHVAGVVGNTNANGNFRVLAVTGTTVTLMGSYGNAAYVSGGTIQNLDQRDIDLTGVSQGAQANNSAMVYRINDTDSGGTQGAESFELYGITHSWSERDPHAE